MSSSKIMERPSLTTHIRRFGQDWGPHSASTAITPFSAVSSFNLPAQYDASLITPVSTTRSPLTMGKHGRGAFRDRELKLSPTVSSPDYLAYSGDEDSKSPMKMRTPGSALQIKTSNSYPGSPLVCKSPYWGAFGVSATSTTPRSRSPGPNESPNTSAGAFSSDFRSSRQATPIQQQCSYRPAHVQAPILIAPNPSTLRGGSRSSSDTHYRHDSMTSMASTPSSQATDPRDYEVSESLGPMPAQRKRKSPPHQDGEAEMSSDMTREDQILIQLSEKESLQWKEIAQRFNELTGKNMKVPALQMRKKRLREKLRVWTDLDPGEVHNIQV